jgi:hypothetical protein
VSQMVNGNLTGLPVPARTHLGQIWDRFTFTAYGIWRNNIQGSDIMVHRKLFSFTVLCVVCFRIDMVQNKDRLIFRRITSKQRLYLYTINDALNNPAANIDRNMW